MEKEEWTKESKRHTDKSESIELFVRDVAQCVEKSEIELSDQFDRKSRLTHSSGRTRSSKSSAKSSGLKEKAKLAALLAQQQT